jgi:hypothetical protein
LCLSRKLHIVRIRWAWIPISCYFFYYLLAHILVKSKYVLSAWLKDSKWRFIVLSVTSKVIKDVWFLGPMNLMRNHAWTRYKCSILNIILIFVFFRISSSWSKAQYGRSVRCIEEKVCTWQIFKKHDYFDFDAYNG